MDQKYKEIERWGRKRTQVFENLNKVLSTSTPIITERYGGKLNYFQLDTFDELSPDTMKGSISYNITRTDSDEVDREYSIVIAYNWEDPYLYDVLITDRYGATIMHQEYEPIGDDIEEIKLFATDFIDDLEDMISNKATQNLVRKAEDHMEQSRKERIESDRQSLIELRLQDEIAKRDREKYSYPEDSHPVGRSY